MSSSLLKIGFIGGGKMAQALAKGFISAGLAKGETIVSSCHPSDLASAKAFKALKAQSFFQNAPVVQNSDIVIISVKPSVVSTVLEDIKTTQATSNKLFLSIAMGVTIKQLEDILPLETRVIRVMPNTAATVRSSMSAFVSGSKATQEDIAVTEKLLNSVGKCEQVTENFLDAITALSGSGPAYIYVLIESLADGGVKMGLPRDLSYRLASQTVLGAAQMVRDTNVHPGILKDDVTSPAGSTAAGLHFLERNGFRAAIIGAVEAATERCRQVAQPTSK